MNTQQAFHDYSPARESFLEDVIVGLGQTNKTLPSKYFYDEVGSALFEQICDQDEYYLTRTELAIMEQHVVEMAASIGRACLLIEYGTGSGRKTRLLLERLPDMAGFVPIDISKVFLQRTVAALRMEFPDLEILPVCADYTKTYSLPICQKSVSKRVVFFPGSTIGNFEPPAAIAFLQHLVQLCGGQCGVLIGVDLKKDAAVLEAAYNDRHGVSSAFNVNLLQRINRELGANFDLNGYHHRGVYNESKGRIESYLVSEAAQTVHLDGADITFTDGEKIRIELSYKYTLDEFQALVQAAGLSVQQVWTDPMQLFSVQYLTI